MNPEVPKWTLAQLNLLDLGNTVQVAGVIYADGEVAYLCMMPEEPLGDHVLRVLELSQEDWKKVIRQTDLVETEVFENAPNGSLAKIIVRKSTRVIEQGVSWAVFRRDGYRCRYCGADKVPLTVDHLVTWEDGGPSIEDNLVACCRKCNKRRGNTPYDKWLATPYYKKVSANLDPNAERKNWEIHSKGLLDAIPLRAHSRGRTGR
jgi:hypothetical protein